MNIVPDTLEELLFDDIPYLKIAQEEHDAFAKVLKDNGVEVPYLEKLMGEVLEIPSCELSRGRGGPGCMSMPIIREDI